MRYFLLLAALTLGCGEPTRPPAAPGGDGAGPLGVTGANGSTGGSSGAGGGGGSGGGGHSTGACDNASDLEALAGGGSVRDVARDCGLLHCMSVIADSDAYEGCVNACVDNDVPGLSSECTGCYGALERCGLDSFCQLRCQSNPCSPMCLSCLDLAGCTEDFETCRGIDGTECTL